MKTNTNQTTVPVPRINEYTLVWQKKHKDSKKELERKVRQTQNIKMGNKESEKFVADWQIDSK